MEWNDERGEDRNVVGIVIVSVIGIDIVTFCKQKSKINTLPWNATILFPLNVSIKKANANLSSS